MMKWLKRLLGICDHTWKVEDKLEISNYVRGNVFRIDYILQCEKCGIIKVKKT